MASTSKFLTAVLNGLALGYFNPFNPENTFLGLGATEAEVIPEVVFNNSRVDAKGRRLPDGIEIRFGGENYVPSVEARERLKAEGFRWSEKQKMWYAYDEPKTRSFVDEFASSPVKVLQFSDEDSKELTEKNWFWAKVRSSAEWEKVPKRAAVKYNGNKEYKSNLKLSDAEISRLIAESKLYFTKFYEKPTGIVVPATKSEEATQDEDLELLELEAEALLVLVELENENKKRKGLDGLDHNVCLGYFGSEIGRPDKEVWLTVAGYNHIVERHEKEIRGYGFGILEFVEHVFTTYQTILEGSNNSILLQSNQKFAVNRSGVLAILLSETVDGNYVIATAFIAKGKYTQKKRKLDKYKKLGRKGGTVL